MKAMLTAENLVEVAKERGTVSVDLKFCDLLGYWRHISLPLAQVDEGVLARGVGFAGSAVSGFGDVRESDALIRPDLNTLCVDRFVSGGALSLICDVIDPITGAIHLDDPRNVARRAEVLVRDFGLPQITISAFPQYYYCDKIAFSSTSNGSSYSVAFENPEQNAAGHISAFAAAPIDALCIDTMNVLTQWGKTVQAARRVCAHPAHVEMELPRASLVSAADGMLIFKYVAKNVAALAGKSATFMPKPLSYEPGSTMVIRQCLRAPDAEEISDDGSALQDIIRYFRGGLLNHMKSLLAFCAPTTNSYKNLNSKYRNKAGECSAGWSAAAVAVRPSMESTNIDFCAADPLANPYLAFSACILAGIDGIRNCTDPQSACGEYEAAMPACLADCLDALRNDNAYLTNAGVFSKSLLEKWIAIKYAREIHPSNVQPHPHEVYLYADA